MKLRAHRLILHFRQDGGDIRRGLMLILGALFAITVSADVSITVGDAAADVIDGADSSMSFQLTRGGGTGTAVTVGYTTLDSTAFSGLDYTSAIGTVTIPASSTSASVPAIAVTGEAGIKPDKQFLVQLLGVGGNGPIPTFGASAAFDTSGVGGFPIAVADFNGDGSPDLAVSSYDSIAILVNNTGIGGTTPSFGPFTAFALGTQSYANSMVAADFNGDGKPDLAAVSLGVSVLLNTTPPGATAASFAAAVNFAFAGSVGTAGDFNGDGRPDLVGVSADGLAFLLNSTPSNAAIPSFVPFDYPLPQASGPATIVSVAAADFNGDGKSDVAVLIERNIASPFFTGYVMEVRFNTTTSGATTPSFSAPVDFALQGGSGSYSSVAVADINGDGRPDISAGGIGAPLLINTSATGAAVPSFSGAQYYTVYNAVLNGQGSLHVATVPSFAGGDFNGDRKFDLVGTVLPSPSGTPGLDILTNVSPSDSSASNFSVPINVPPFSSANQAVAVADFNGDGKPDLAVTNGDSSVVRVLLNTTQPGPATSMGGPNVGATGTIHYQSDVPAAFTFTPLFDAALNTIYASNSIVVSGTNIPSPISVTGGQYNINGGAYTAASSTVQPGSSVTVQLRSSSSYFSATQATLTIGAVSASFSVATEAEGGSSSSGSSGGGSGSSSSSGGHSSSSGSGSSSSSGGSGSSSSGGSGSSSGGGSSGSGGHGSSGGGSSSSSGGSSSGGGAASPTLLLFLGCARLFRGRRRKLAM